MVKKIFFFIIVGLLFFIQISCIFNIINHTYIEEFNNFMSHDSSYYNFPIKNYNQLLQDNFLVAYNKYLLNHCECCKEWRVKYTDLEKKEIKNSFDESFLNNSNYYNLSSNIVLDNLISDDLIKNGNYVDVPILHPEISINTSIFDDKLYEISNIVKKKENCEKLKCLNLENEHVHNTFDMDTVECKMQNDKIISEITRPHDDFVLRLSSSALRPFQNPSAILQTPLPFHSLRST